MSFLAAVATYGGPKKFVCVFDCLCFVCVDLSVGHMAVAWAVVGCERQRQCVGVAVYIADQQYASFFSLSACAMCCCCLAGNVNGNVCLYWFVCMAFA